jgi:hypothetical protein
VGEHEGAGELDEDADDEEEDEDDDDEDDEGEVAGKDSFENSRFQSRPGRKQPGWFIPRWCAEVTRNPTEARVLAQMAHRFGVSGKIGRCRAKIYRDGFLWIYKHYPQLARETRLTEKQVGDAMRSFIARGVVVAVDDDEHGRLLRLDPVRIEAILLSEDAGDEQ